MRSLLLFSLISFQALATEVATLKTSRTSKEILIDLTDATLYQEAEKLYSTQPCRFKTTTNFTSNLRETIIPEGCRAELTKFLLNAGYKPIDARTFIK